jgi:hypothetical protein
MLRTMIAVMLLGSSLTFAQESQLHADFRGEGERFKASCEKFSAKSAMGCAQLLFTDHPLHIAVGSIAPQNGFGAGAALVGHWTPNELWRTSWNVDAVASSNASWRTGAYLKLIHTPIENITPVTTSSAPSHHGSVIIHPYTVINLYAQSISLNKIYYYGLGPNSPKTDQTVFGIQETITGESAIIPIAQKWNISLLEELNGRFVGIRGNHEESAPSIEQRFAEVDTPGLNHQPTFLQFGEGLRIKPSLANNHIQLDYSAQFQQFIGSPNSFRRFTADLGHTFPLYRYSGSYGPKDTNGPDECAVAVGASKCPSITNNREGSIGVRLLIVESAVSSGNSVPFYFQPTLGGSDINGTSWLGSYDDYRFRAPNALVLRESFEHSVWGPLGFVFSADQGKVALTRSDIAFDHLAHSFSVGATLRAAGLPALSLAFCWGGHEGNHTITNVNTSLMGGSNRPSFF